MASSLEAVEIRRVGVGVDHLSVLAGGDKRPQAVRFSPTGNVYIPSEFGLDYREFNDLGTAIQEAEFALGKGAVSERDMVERLINSQSLLCSVMVEGRLTKKRLGHVLPEIQRSLLDYRQELSDLRESGGFDKRVQSLTTEARFDSAFWQGLKAHIQGKIIEENRPCLGLLILEKKFSEQTIERTIDGLGEFNKILADIEAIRSGRKAGFSEVDPRKMIEFLQVVAASLIEVRFNPYLGPALGASVNLDGSLRGRSEVDREILRGVSDVIGLDPVTDLIRKQGSYESRTENR